MSILPGSDNISPGHGCNLGQGGEALRLLSERERKDISRWGIVEHDLSGRSDWRWRLGGRLN